MNSFQIPRCHSQMIPADNCILSFSYSFTDFQRFFSLLSPTFQMVVHGTPIIQAIQWSSGLFTYLKKGISSPLQYPSHRTNGFAVFSLDQGMIFIPFKVCNISRSISLVIQALLCHQTRACTVLPWYTHSGPPGKYFPFPLFSMMKLSSLACHSG